METDETVGGNPEDIDETFAWKTETKQKSLGLQLNLNLEVDASKQRPPILPSPLTKRKSLRKDKLWTFFFPLEF